MKKKLLFILIFFNIVGSVMAFSRYPDEVILSNTRGAINLLVADYGHNVEVERQNEARTLITRMLSARNSRYRRIALQAFDQIEDEILREYNEVVNGSRNEDIRVHRIMLRNVRAVRSDFNI